MMDMVRNPKKWIITSPTVKEKSALNDNTTVPINQADPENQNLSPPVQLYCLSLLYRPVDNQHINDPVHPVNPVKNLFFRPK